MKNSGRVAIGLAVLLTVGGLWLAARHGRTTSVESPAHATAEAPTGSAPAVADLEGFSVLDAQVVPLNELASGYLINLENTADSSQHLLLRVHSRAAAEPLLNDRSKVPTEGTAGGQVRYLFPGTQQMFGLVAEYYGPKLYVTLEAQGGTEDLIRDLARSLAEKSGTGSGVAFEIPAGWRQTSEGPSPAGMAVFSLTRGDCSIAIQSMPGGAFAATEALRTMSLHAAGGLAPTKATEINANSALGTLSDTAVEVRTSTACDLRAIDVLAQAHLTTPDEWTKLIDLAARRQASQQGGPTTTVTP